MDGMIEIFRGQDESDITIKAGGKWKYHGEKGMGGGSDPVEMKITNT